MDVNQQEKIARFLKDEIMSNAVYDTLLSTFLEGTKTTDVQTLAAERIAITLLQNGWKTLERYKAKAASESPKNRQIGI